MNIYNLLSVSLAVVIYRHLAREMRSGTAEQNLATWISWLLLDFVIGISLFVQHGNWYLLAVYVGGSIFISYHIIRSAKFEWGIIENICFLFFLTSIVLWYFSSPWYATLISTIGIAIATIPQIIDAATKPTTAPTKTYVGFVIVNGLSTAGGKAWTMEERFYPTVCIILCLLIVGFSLRKYFVGERAHNA